MEVYQKENLYAKYYNNPKEFHKAIQNFFKDINQNFQEALKSLLSLKFQFFDNKKTLIYPLWSIIAFFQHFIVPFVKNTFTLALIHATYFQHNLPNLFLLYQTWIFAIL